MSEVRELREGESRRAAAALLELRPHVGSPEAMARAHRRVSAPAAIACVGAFDAGAEDAAAVAGFRIGENLAWGRFLYVDDLVTRAAAPRARARRRGDGVGGGGGRRARAAASCTWTRASAPTARTPTASTSATGMRITSYHFAAGASS